MGNAALRIASLAEPVAFVAGAPEARVRVQVFAKDGDVGEYAAADKVLRLRAYLGRKAELTAPPAPQGGGALASVLLTVGGRDHYSDAWPGFGARGALEADPVPAIANVPLMAAIGLPPALLAPVQVFDASAVRWVWAELDDSATIDAITPDDSAGLIQTARWRVRADAVAGIAGSSVLVDDRGEVWRVDGIDPEPARRTAIVSARRGGY